MTPGRRGWIVIAAYAFVLVAFGLAGHLSKARGQAPGHTHDGAAGRFYQTWQMPDARHASCCSEKDCGPAQAKFESGGWWARWTDEDEWTRVPEAKVEHDRDTPDGSAHMCGRRAVGGEVYVYCFINGAGG